MKKLQKDWMGQIGSEEEQEVVSYGIDRIRENVCAFIFTALVGFCWGSLLSGILLWILVYPIRCNAGGYHAKTKWGCRFMSVAVLIVVYTVIYSIVDLQNIQYGILFITGLIIWMLAPLDTENKPLDSNEREVYRKRVRCILSGEIIVSIVAYLVEIQVVFLAVNMAFMVSTVLLLLGKAKQLVNK